MHDFRGMLLDEPPKVDEWSVSVAGNRTWSSSQVEDGTTPKEGLKIPAMVRYQPRDPVRLRTLATGPFEKGWNAARFVTAPDRSVRRGKQTKL